MPVLAIGAVDAVLLIAALAVILLLWAGQYVLQVVGYILGHLPLVGGYVAGVISSWTESVLQAANALWDDGVHPLAHFFWVLGTGAWHLLYNVVGATQAVNNVAHSALNAAGAAGAAIAPAVAGGLADAEAYANQLGQDLLNDARNLANSAITHADGLFGTTEADATNLFDTAEADATSLYNSSIAHADDLYNQAIATVQSVGLQILGDVDADIAKVDAQIASVQDVLNSEIDQVLSQSETFAQDLVAGLGVGALAAELTSVLPRVATLEAEAAECLEPLCDTVVPNAKGLGSLGNFLNNLELLGIDAFIIALAAEAVTDPAAVVADVTAVVNDVGGPILAGFRDLIGV